MLNMGLSPIFSLYLSPKSKVRLCTSWHGHAEATRSDGIMLEPGRHWTSWRTWGLVHVRHEQHLLWTVAHDAKNVVVVRGLVFPKMKVYNVTALANKLGGTQKSQELKCFARSACSWLMGSTKISKNMYLLDHGSPILGGAGSGETKKE